MRNGVRLDQVSLAIGLIGLGVLTFVYGDFAMQWQPVPAWVPGREALAYLSGAVLLGTGAGLLGARTATRASSMLLVYLILWLLLLKLPRAIAAPLVEVNWLGVGETTVMLLGGWVVFASLRGDPRTRQRSFATSDRAMLVVKYLFGVCLIPIGLSHFMYFTQSLSFVPAWLPQRAWWVYLTGAGHIAAGLGVVFGVLPYLAATLEAAMIGVFTVLVWIPGIVAAPTSRLQWTAMFISWTIAAGAWVVAGSLAPVRQRTAAQVLEAINEQPAIAR